MTQTDSLLQHPAYVRYWFARVCSGFAFQMLSVAAGLAAVTISGLRSARATNSRLQMKSPRPAA